MLTSPLFRMYMHSASPRSQNHVVFVNEKLSEVLIFILSCKYISLLKFHSTIILLVI